MIAVIQWRWSVGGWWNVGWRWRGFVVLCVCAVVLWRSVGDSRDTVMW